MREEDEQDRGAPEAIQTAPMPKTERRRWTFGLLFSFGIILFKGARWWRILLLVVSALFVVLVGPSRIYLGDHWASDVLGSYLIGGVLLGIALWIYLKLKERGVLKTEQSRNRSLASNRFRFFSGK